MTIRPGFEGFIRWCCSVRKELLEQLAPLQSGTCRIGRRPPNGPYEDITGREVNWLKTQLAEIDSLIAQYSVNPS